MENWSLIDQVITQTEDTIASDLDGEVVLASITNQKYYNLGDIGGEIWSKLSEPIAVRQLINELAAEYQVDYLKCEEDVISFIDHLYKEKLVQVVV